jgi:DNA-binding GntR family transcriptional regulator
VKKTKLTVEKLNEKAYVLIKAAILNNELPSGTRIIDSEIGEKFSISRTPARDAIQMLIRDGLIEKKGISGYYVFSPTQKAVDEIYDIRLMIDREVITRLVTELMPANPEYYEAKLGAIDPGSDDLVENAFIVADERFHGSFVSLCDNSRLSRIYDDNRNQVKVFREITAYNSGRVARAIRAHRHMLDRISAGDLAAALEAATDHVESSRKDALADVRILEERRERSYSNP